MPRTKLDSKRGEDIVRLIWGYMAMRGLTVSDLAERTSISETRLYCRKKKPEDFTVAELTRICRNLTIPIEEVRAAIKY